MQRHHTTSIVVTPTDGPNAGRPMVLSAEVAIDMGAITSIREPSPPAEGNRHARRAAAATARGRRPSPRA